MHPPETPYTGPFDFVVSEAAVGQVDGVRFTVAGIREVERGGAVIPTTYLDIERSRIVDVEPDSVVTLREGLALRVVAIVSAGDPMKGKVYFQRA